MYDMKILKHARHYIAAMADGINPLTGEFAAQDDTISQERIQSCLSQVAEILDELIERGGSFGNRKMPFSITDDQLRLVKISDEPIGINDVAKRINDVLPKNTRGISGAKISGWFAKNGYLNLETEVKMETRERRTTRKVLNTRSHEVGITSIQRTGANGVVYEKILYSNIAQQFILDNIKKIIGN